MPAQRQNSNYHLRHHATIGLELHSLQYSINEFDGVSKPIYHVLAALLLCLAAARGSDTHPAFLGASSCSSSSCHGGGGASQNQFLVWSVKDFHSQRPTATLTTARAKQIGDALGIKDPTTDERCTSCHAPLAGVPEELRGENFKVSEGVSCENCHGPAQKWLRPHTRTDYTRADRTAAGMRDLQDLYVRANTCVACHQVVSPPLLQAGHPELIFELDGQSVTEPRHWRPEKNGIGAQAWFVGQAVALRETSWELAREESPSPNEINRWHDLVWLMSRARSIDTTLPQPPSSTFRPNRENFEQVQQWSDHLAQTAAKLNWTSDLTQTALTTLAATSADFSSAIPQPVNARRAERLVLALDRLFAGGKNPRADAELNQLFALAQSLPDFEPKKFAEALDQFSKSTGRP
jgi:hypothetical protein